MRRSTKRDILEGFMLPLTVVLTLWAIIRYGRFLTLIGDIVWAALYKYSGLQNLFQYRFGGYGHSVNHTIKPFTFDLSLSLQRFILCAIMAVACWCVILSFEDALDRLPSQAATKTQRALIFYTEPGSRTLFSAAVAIVCLVLLLGIS